MQRMLVLAKTFTPGRPVSRLEDFAPRLDLLRDVFGVISQEGQHVAMFGEPGVGKTSLANIVGESFARTTDEPIRSIRIGCNTRDSFHDVWETAFKQLRIDAPDDFTPRTIAEALYDLNFHPLIVMDEIDRFDDNDGLSLLADTVKALSDHNIYCTVVLVGVSDSIQGLIGDHQSVRRALVEVKVSRMSHKELRRITDRMEKLGLRGAERQRDRIAVLSEGLPHYAHLLCYFAAERAISDDKTTLSKSDVDAAIERAVRKGQDSVKRAHSRAIRSQRSDSLFEQVLLACALAEKDDVGFFPPANVRRPLQSILGRDVPISAYTSHLHKFAEEARGPVLHREGQPRQWSFRFIDPMLQPYVILSGIQRGLISESAIGAGQG